MPYTIGGAEKMWWGLQREINTNTCHQAEIIKLVAKEHSFWDLVDSYEAFSKLDLSGFDLVISGKYPAWMVSHPRHLCYMQHRLRGLYDCYHYARLPERYNSEHPEITGLQRSLEKAPTRGGLDEVFFRLRAMRYEHDIPPGAFQFPGPLIKQIVAYLDAAGLGMTEIEGYFAISRTVAQRPSYFPSEASVQVLYPPSNLEGLHGSRFDYIFTASRLDGAKRIHLLVQAMKFVKTNIELRIAGEGPDRTRLEAAAAGDDRIRFIGFRSDAELIEDYANALAIAFVPTEEDYGLITIEAMMSGKPVITTTDAGGPTEFVRNGETGVCVEATPEQIGSAIDRLAADRQAAAAMGETARDMVQGITWENTVNRLLGGIAKKPATTGLVRRRRKITIATTFPIVPVRGGGQARIYHFYKNLVPAFEVDLITLAECSELPSNKEIAPGLREIRIPKTSEHAAAEAKVAAQVDWFSITDAVFPILSHLTPAYSEALARSAREAEVVIASHPYAIDVIKAVADKPIWYEAHNVEYNLKRAVIPQTARGLALIEEVHRVEKLCCEQAALIMVCSEEDQAQLQQLYDVDSRKCRLVPNGIDAANTRFIPRSIAASQKNSLGLGGHFLATFVGSWHQPNLDAIETLLAIAPQHPDVHFLILGSSGEAFRDRQTPHNIVFFGAVDDATKALVVSASDLALNPMRNGSGTNLKMLDYAASGVPILTTRTGLRGLRFVPEREVFVAPQESLSNAIQQIRQTPSRRLETMTSHARERVEREFDWRHISRRFLASL